MPEGHDTTFEVCNIISVVLYTQVLKRSVLKPASPEITISVANIYDDRSLCIAVIDGLS